MTDDSAPGWAVDLTRDVAEVRTTVIAVVGALKDLEARSEKIETKVAEIAPKVWSTAGMLAASGAAIALVGGLVAFFMPYYIGHHVQESVRRELGYRETIVQDGRFSSATKDANSPFTYVWNLNTPVVQSDVQTVSAVSLTALPGVSVKAAVVGDGKQCRMTLSGSEAALSQIPDEVDARVTIELRDQS
jgi:hypothetical protein